MPARSVLETEPLRPSPNIGRTVRFLAGLLPKHAAAFHAALQNSRDAFELADHWLHLDCTSVLSTGAPELDTGATLPRLDDFPVGSLLCLPTDAGQWYGLDAIKAMLLVDRFTERQEDRKSVVE